MGECDGSQPVRVDREETLGLGSGEEDMSELAELPDPRRMRCKLFTGCICAAASAADAYKFCFRKETNIC